MVPRPFPNEVIRTTVTELRERDNRLGYCARGQARRVGRRLKLANSQQRGRDEYSRNGATRRRIKYRHELNVMFTIG